MKSDAAPTIISFAYLMAEQNKRFLHIQMTKVFNLIPADGETESCWFKFKI
jgi:hypothetical protein